jgi:hypothetical protein
MQNRPLVQNVVRAGLFVSPFLFLVLGQCVSYAVAALFILIEAVCLWKVFDYDIKNFPLFVVLTKKISKYQNLSEMYGYFLHRIYFTILPFSLLYFLFFFVLREFSPELYYDLILRNSFSLDVVMAYINGLPQELSNYTIEEKKAYLSELYLLSKQQAFYFSTFDTYRYVEVTCVFLNVFIISMCFEVLCLSIFVKGVIHEPEYFFTYELIIIRTIFGSISFIFLLLFMLMVVEERYPMDHYGDSILITYLLPFFLFISVPLLFFIFESFCIIAFFLFKKWFSLPR